MKKPWHYVTAGTLLFSLTLGLVGGASAETAGDTTNAKGTEPASLSVPAQKESKPVFMYRMGHSGLLQSESHERNYLKLLVKAYTPESEAAWSAAFEERKQVEKLLPKAAAAVKALPKDEVQIQKLDKDAVPPVTEDGKEPVVKVKPVDGQEWNKTFVVRLEKAHSGAGGEGQSILPLGAALPDDILKAAESGHEVPPQLKLQMDFTKAVEADDASAIKELLPQLLEDYKNKTVQLGKVAEKLKQAESKEAVQEQTEQTGQE
ncbi:MAG: hypothetical protein K0S39_1560 [Paenibacillus sp.]|jgi:hypothetical protein|nr:hypothetical protein [Paenibacillus sp.]